MTTIGDWKITKGRSGYHLHHMRDSCKKRHMRFTGKSYYGWYAYKRDGSWYCPNCDAIAPDEVGFLAELSDCPQNHNEFVDRIERHENAQKHKLKR